MASQFRATYLPNIARRLNQRFLDGLVLDPVDIGIMQDLCGFSAEINGDTRFCDIFERTPFCHFEMVIARERSVPIQRPNGWTMNMLTTSITTMGG